MQEMNVRSLGWEDPLEKKMATHSSILVWIIPWTEEPGRLRSMGSQRVRNNLNSLSTHAPEIDDKIRKQKPQQLLHTSLSPAAVTNCCNFLQGPGPTGPSVSKFLVSQFAQGSLPVDRGAWRAAVRRVARSWTRLK